VEIYLCWLYPFYLDCRNIEMVRQSAKNPETSRAIFPLGSALHGKSFVYENNFVMLSFNAPDELNETLTLNRFEKKSVKLNTSPGPAW